MKFRVIHVLFLALMIVSFTGCAKKVDPARPIEKIRKEVVTMSVAKLEVRASAYAAAIRAQKVEMEKIQQQIKKMPMEKVFSDKSMTHHIAEIGRTAEALFERYMIYVKAFQEKGGDVAKVQIEAVRS